MENLELRPTPELIDLLARETARYTKMLASGANDAEFEKCRDRITELQLEIQKRKGQKDPASSKRLK